MQNLSCAVKNKYIVTVSVIFVLIITCIYIYTHTYTFVYTHSYIFVYVYVIICKNTAETVTERILIIGRSGFVCK